MLQESLAFNHFFTQIKSHRNYIVVALLAIFCSYSAYFFFSPQTIILLGDENSFFELATAFCFFVSAVMLIILFIKRRNIFFLLLGILLFVGAGEELSWGQHLFKFKTPDTIKANNVQGEFNFHNIEIFNTDKFNSSRKTGWQRLLEINFIFRLFCIFYGIIIPLASVTLSPVKQLKEKINLPIPAICIGIFFFLNWVAYKFTLLITAKNQSIPYYETSTEIFEFIASFIWLLISYLFLKEFEKIKMVVKDL